MQIQQRLKRFKQPPGNALRRGRQRVLVEEYSRPDVSSAENGLTQSSIFVLAANILGIIRNILTPFALIGCSTIFSWDLSPSMPIPTSRAAYRLNPPEFYHPIDAVDLCFCKVVALGQIKTDNAPTSGIHPHQARTGMPVLLQISDIQDLVWDLVLLKVVVYVSLSRHILSALLFPILGNRILWFGFYVPLRFVCIKEH
jgi:hypothetical protein